MTLCNTSSTLENQAKDNLFPALLTDLESSGFRSKGAMAAIYGYPYFKKGTKELQ